jgi:hypothetical protein
MRRGSMSYQSGRATNSMPWIGSPKPRVRRALVNPTLSSRVIHRPTARHCTDFRVAETAAMLFWALLTSGQITMRKVDGWQSLAVILKISKLLNRDRGLSH